MADVLTLTNVSKRFGRFTAVDRFNLRVAAGEVLGFLGPNGAGKTTTIRMVMSIIYPDEGDVSVLGHPRASDVKDRIGYLPEERGLYRKMTVEQTLRYFGRLKGLHGATLSRRIGEALERVALQDWGRKRNEALSKGMQQKLQFIIAVLHRPELVILDEPFSGLDPLNVELLKELIAELRDSGTTVVLSTHQMDQAQRLCDRIVLINRGRKLIEGTMHEIRSRFAARILEFEGEGDFEPLRRAAGVVAARVTAAQARLELDEGAEPNAILKQAADLARLSRFEIQRPDLQEIFVRLVGSDRPGADDARMGARAADSPREGRA